MDQAIIDSTEISIAEEANKIFLDKLTNPELTSVELGAKYNLSVRTIQTRLKLARESFNKELDDAAETLRADMWRKYERIEKELWGRWDSTGDIAVMVQIRGVYSDMRKMFSLDKPIKAPVNEEGKAVEGDRLIIVMSPDKYDALEREQASKKTVIIENQRTIAEPKETI